MQGNLASSLHQLKIRGEQQPLQYLGQVHCEQGVDDGGLGEDVGNATAVAGDNRHPARRARKALQELRKGVILAQWRKRLQLTTEG